MHWRAVTFLALGLIVPSAHAQIDDSNGFDMGQAYRAQASNTYSDENAQFPVEGQANHPYPKYQFKNAGASKVIIPDLNTGDTAVGAPQADAATTENTTQPSTQQNTTATPANDEVSPAGTAAAASGDASYYKDIINKVRTQGDAAIPSEPSKDQKKIAEYKF